MKINKEKLIFKRKMMDLGIFHFIEKNERLLSVLNLANKTKILKYSMQTYCIYPEDNKCGYRNEDVTGFWDFSSLFERVKSEYLSFLEIKNDFGILEAINSIDLRITVSGWVWVIDSKDSVKYEILHKKLRKSKETISKENYEKLVKEISEDEINLYLEEHYIKVSDRMFFSKTDPSVFIYDEKYKKYNLTNGWTTEQIGEILEEWICEIIDSSKKIKSKHINGASW